MVSAPRVFFFFFLSFCGSLCFNFQSSVASRLSLSLSHSACGKHDAKASRDSRLFHGKFLHRYIFSSYLPGVYFLPFVWLLRIAVIFFPQYLYEVTEVLSFLVYLSTPSVLCQIHPVFLNHSVHQDFLRYHVSYARKGDILFFLSKVQNR